MKPNDLNQPRLIIQAYNIHIGGGKVLLEALLEDLQNTHLILFLDTRLIIKDLKLKRAELKYVKPKLFNRIVAEIWMKHNVRKNDIVLCFGNLPPLFKLKGKIYLFLQNRLLLDDISFKAHDFKTGIRLILERLWLKFFMHNCDEALVQTDTMKEHAILSKLKDKKHIIVCPFLPNSKSCQTASLKTNKKFDFIYVASGDKHKNHKNLIEAWILLKKKGYSLTLAITIDPKKYKILYQNYLLFNKKYDLNITNFSELSYQQVNLLYQDSKVLIYPSLIESFGMPLLEAKRYNLPIIASEKDYVRDLVNPVESFDPHSPKSICNAIIRYIGKNEINIILTPLQFINKLQNKS